MSKPCLHFNSSAAANGFEACIKQAADKLLDILYSEIQNDLKTQAAKTELDKMTDDEEQIIRRYVVGYAHAIMESYGTGSEMEKDNPALDEYRSSSLWNPLRQGYEIAGRAEGKYTNILGQERKSSGKSAGMNLENKIKPVSPTRAFQEAEIWVLQGNRINEVLNQYISDWISNISKYFEYR